MADVTLTHLRERRAEILKQLAELKAEDRELSIAEGVLQRLAPPKGRLAPPKGRFAAPAVGSRAEAANLVPMTGSPAPTSQRELVVSVLGHADEVWLKSSQVRDLIHDIWGVDIPEKSLRPLLSYMKRDGIVARRGRMLALQERVTESARTTRVRPRG